MKPHRWLVGLLLGLFCLTTLLLTPQTNRLAWAAPSTQNSGDPYDFPDVLPAYTHPRVFVTADELPALEARLTASGYDENMTSWLKQKVVSRVGSGYLRELADMTVDPSNVTDQQIDDVFFSYGEFEMHDLAVMALWGRIFTSGEANYVASAKETARDAAHNYALIAQAIHTMVENDDYSAVDAATEAVIKSHWDQQGVYGFKPGHILRNGSMGLALAYDLLYDDYTTDEQNAIRQALIIGTEGWNIRGGDDTNLVGMDGNAVSNHYGYQGNQAVMLAAIYGEAGFPQADWDAMVQVIQNYVRVAFNEDGASVEDSYGPDLGLREGGRALIALARQGEDEFALFPDKMRQIGYAVAHDIEAVENGALIGGESGGNYAFGPSSPSGENPNPTYPSFHIIWKHVFPNDGVIDHLYRWRVGDDYRRILKSQSTIDYAFFGGPYAATPEAEPFDLMQFYPQRGKLVVRNDQSNDAVQFVFDARPDAFNIGHDKSGRGHFSLNGLGQRWVSHLNFRDVRLSQESSTMHIDGVGQAYKAPSVKFLGAPADDGVLVTVSADLSYAYNYQWNQPWTNSADQSPTPDGSDPTWEHDTTDPASFFTVGDAPDWLGDSLWDDRNMGYNGMWMWRRPHLPVQKAVRTIAYLRTENPAVIIADDIRQDDASHLYESFMQLPFDLDQMSVNGNDAILWRTGESERLLVRVLQAEATSGSVTFTNEAYTTSQTAMDARRLRIGVNAIEPKLKIMLWPHIDGTPPPQTSWDASMSMLTIDGIDQAPVVLTVDDEEGYSFFGRTPPAALTLRSVETSEHSLLFGLFSLLSVLSFLGICFRPKL